MEPEAVESAAVEGLDGGPEAVPQAEPESTVADAGALPAAVAAAATTVTAAAVNLAGGVQISAEADLDVFLDGEFVGRTSAKEDGLYLAGLKKGRHVIKVEKSGFVAQTFEVEVVSRPIEVEVSKFIPVAAAPAAAAGSPQPLDSTQVGSLVVTSAPQNITVEIDGRVEEKRTPQLSIGGLPVGEHVITFRKDGYEPVTSTIVIEAGAENTVHGDLKSTRVEVVHQGKGSLRIISKPMRCTIWFRDEIHDKTHDRLNLSKIPAGEYPMMVMIPGRKLTTTVLIVDEQRTTVEVSFMKGDDPFVITRVQK